MQSCESCPARSATSTARSRSPSARRSTGGVEYPHYTRPASYRGWDVPDVLLSGHHAEVRRWRLEQAPQPQCSVPAGVRDLHVGPAASANIRAPRVARAAAPAGGFFSPMSELIQTLERRQVRQVPDFRVGDRVRVHFQVVEGTRRRTQVFEGVVLKEKGGGPQRTFTVRKLSFGVGRGADVPRALAQDRADRGRRPRRGAAREALLPARPGGPPGARCARCGTSAPENVGTIGAGGRGRQRREEPQAEVPEDAEAEAPEEAVAEETPGRGDARPRRRPRPSPSPRQPPRSRKRRPRPRPKSSRSPPRATSRASRA